MIWPFSAPSKILFELDKDDEIVETNEIFQGKNVFAILTKTSIYFVSIKPTSLNILSKFRRNSKSIENYGLNDSIISNDENVFIIKTDLNCLMIFTINNNENDKSSNNDLLEVLNVFNDEKECLLQDVYLTNESSQIHYYDIQLKFKVVLKLGNQLIGYNLFKNQKYFTSNVLVILIKKNKNLIFQFLNSHDFSTIQSLFLDECPWFISRNNDMDITYYTYNQDLQLFSFIMSDGNCWMFRFNDGISVKNNSEVESDHQELESKQCPFINWANTTGYCIYNKGNALKIKFNNDFKTFIILTKENCLEYYSFRHYIRSNSIEFLKRFRNPLNSKKIVNFKIFNLNHTNVPNFKIIIFNNGWCIVSNFGNVNFSTFDYDNTLGGIQTNDTDNSNNNILLKRSINHINHRKSPDNWFNQIKDINYIDSSQQLVILTKDKAYQLDLIVFLSKYQIDANFKIPVFIHKSNLIISNINNEVEYYNGNNESRLDNEKSIASLSSPSSPSLQNIPRLSHAIDIGPSNNTYTQLTNNKNIDDNNEDSFFNFQVPFNIMSELNNNIEILALSKDHDKLLCYGNKQLYYHNFKTNEWFAFDDGYYDELLNTRQLLFWNNDFAFLNHENLETGKFEILTFNLNKVSKNRGFNTSSLIWKYELDHNVKYMNLDNLNSELILLTDNWSLIIFKLSNALTEFNKKQVLINVVIKTNISNLKILDDYGDQMEITNKTFGNFNLIRVNSYNNDLLLLLNGDLFLLKIFDGNKDKKYMKFKLFHNIEYFNKLAHDNLFYCFNGDEILFFNLDIPLDEYPNNLLDFKLRIDKVIKELQVLTIKNFNDDQFYPIQMVLGSNYYLEGLTLSLNEVSQSLKIKTFKKFILHEFLNFEITNVHDDSLVKIYNKYKKVSNFDYSNELLLYQTIIENDKLLRKLLKFILLNPHHLSIIAQCLRKIEIEYWSKVFQILEVQPVELFHKCLNSKDYKTAGYYLIIFLSFIDKENEKVSKICSNNREKRKTNDSKARDIGNDSQNKKEIFNFLKLILDCNFNSDLELLEMSVELIRFLKVLDQDILIEALSIIEK